MFKEQMNKLKSLIPKKIDEKDGKTNKRKIENLAFFLVVLIITLIAINSIMGNDKKETKKDEGGYKVLADIEASNNVTYEDELEKRLENILETMVGIGKVKVLITYTKSSEVVPMYNENNTTSQTSETDSSGGTRTIEEKGTNKEIIFTEENGASVPATQVVVNPKVEGVIVTAEGANDSTVKANIISAVEAVTGAPAHKVQVFSMN